MVKRQRVWIDEQVQGALVGRVVLYWTGLVLYLGISMACFQGWQNPTWTAWEHTQAMFDQVWPCLPTLVVLLPMVIFDIVRLSNRFVGPVYRLRMHLAQLNENPNTYPLNFRDDDYWQQLAEPINELQCKLLELEHKVETLSAEQQDSHGVNVGAAYQGSIANGEEWASNSASVETPLFDRR